MGWITTATYVIFFMPKDKDLHDKFVESHDMTEWEKRPITTLSGKYYVEYTKEETMMLENTSKF